MRGNNIYITLSNRSKKPMASIAFVHAFLCLVTSTLMAQSDKKMIIEGNENFNKKDYEQAEQNYQKALLKNKNSYAANFNLANTLYKKGKYEEAANCYQGLTHKPVSKDTLSKVYHNLGNSLLQQRKYEESISAYKNALKYNAKDDDARYNLAYAQSMLKQQQQNQNKKDNKDNKNDNKDKDNKDKKKEEKERDKKNNPNKEKNKSKENKEKDKEQSPEQPQLSKEDAQRMLDALQNDEKNVRDKLKKKIKVGERVQIEKDW
jgi:Ca-activated chloride channel family protein